MSPFEMWIQANSPEADAKADALAKVSPLILLSYEVRDPDHPGSSTPIGLLSASCSFDCHRNEKQKIRMVSPALFPLDHADRQERRKYSC